MTSIASVIFIVLFFKVAANDVCYWPLEITQPKVTPENCAVVFSPGKNVTGVYKLEVGGLKFEAQCIPDPEKGPAWTVIQRRMDGSVDFYRDYGEYENGFGNKYGEYWLGLKYMYGMLSSEKYELWVKLDSYDGKSWFAIYGQFYLADASKQYIIHVYNYFGNAGDNLSQHNGLKFYARDKDDCLNCADYYKGAWWMGMPEDCYYSHLNGLYGQNNAENETGVKWHGLGFQSMKYSHMAIRPARYSSNVK